MGGTDVETSHFKLLENRDIITYFIDRPWITYRTNNDIDALGLRFGMPNPEGSNRASKMSSIFSAVHVENRTSEFLSYLFSLSELRPIIDDYLHNRSFSQLAQIENFEPANLTGEMSTDITIVANEIKRVILEKVNDILLYSHLKLVFNGSMWDVVPADVKIKITVPTNRINDGYIADLLAHGLDDLKDNDFDSVVTKSRTLIEETYLQILDDNQVEYKRNGKINQYRKLVVQTLGMKPSENWNPRIIKMVGCLSTITDVIAEMRNKDSDAHSSDERVKIQAAEAELLLNTSVSVATYYLKINDRHGENI